MLSHHEIAQFPKGPSIERWLAPLPPPGEGEAPSPEAFGAYLRTEINARPIHDPELVLDVANELVGMNFPDQALELLTKNPTQGPETFGRLLIKAAAAMLSGDLTTCVEASRAAHELEPEQPAPYVNLVRILLHRANFAEATQWCKAGVFAAPDHRPLWQLLEYCAAALPSGEGIELVRDCVESTDSWIGATLLASLVSPEDPHARLAALTTHYNLGNRTPEFLIDYTGALGTCNQYDAIPQVVWQAERTASARLPWQLYVHNAQAQLALGKEDAFREQLIKLKTFPDLPPDVLEGLQH